jgi:hypothetical protein
MSDIFLSYARKNRAHADRLASALKAEGWSVWWDCSIPAGKTFDEVIERELDGASCVIVLWTTESIGNPWVRSEAEEGAARGILVPVLVEDVRIPLAFRRIQAASLIGWNGQRTSPQYLRLVDDIAALLHLRQRVVLPSTSVHSESTSSKDANEAERFQRVGASIDNSVQPRTKVEPTGQPVERVEPALAGSSAVSASQPAERRSRRGQQVAYGLQAASVTAGIVATYVDVHSVVVSAPIVTTLGAFLVWFGIRSASRATLWAGIYGVAICSTGLAMVWINGWGPVDAKGPLRIFVSILGAPYVLWSLAALKVWKRPHSEV